MQVKTGDRFKMQGDCCTRFGTVQGDLDETSPSWPLVPLLLDGPGEVPFVGDITQLRLVPPLWGPDQSHKQGIADIIGKWPGDETDEQVLQALEELS